MDNCKGSPCEFGGAVLTAPLKRICGTMNMFQVSQQNKGFECVV